MSWTLRILGAIALFGVAADHLYEYFVDQYSTVPTIGTLFLLDSIGAVVLGLTLLAPLQSLLAPQPARRVLVLAATGGIVLAATSLAGLFVSETTPLFGFREFGYRPVIQLAIVTEAAAMVLLGAFLALSGRPPTLRSGFGTMERRRISSNRR